MLRKQFFNNQKTTIHNPHFVVKFVGFKELTIYGTKRELREEDFERDKEFIKAQERKINQAKLQDEIFYKREYGFENIDIMKGLEKFQLKTQSS